MSKEYDVGRKYHELGVPQQSRTGEEKPFRVGKTARDKQSGAWGHRFSNRSERRTDAAGGKTRKAR